MDYHTGRLTITSDELVAWATIALRALRQRLTTIRRRIPIPAQVTGYNSRLYVASAARELAAAKALFQQNQIRAAGAVAGLALELHLKHVAAAHSISIRHHATIAQMQDRLRYAGLLDRRQRKLIGKLPITRNLCVHGRREEPSRAQVERLIAGIEELQQTRDARRLVRASDHPLACVGRPSACARALRGVLRALLLGSGRRRRADV